VDEPAEPELGQLALFVSAEEVALAAAAPALPRLDAVPAPPVHDPRRLSYTALSTFSQCSYKYYARYVVGMRERTHEPAEGLGATGVGSAVHAALEALDFTRPGEGEVVLADDVVAADAERIHGFVDAYRTSGLARRIGELDGARAERPFAFEHDGVILHGFMDVLHLGERALVVDFKTNALEGASPQDVADADYRLQRLVYALACFRAGAEEVEVIYQFLERPDDLVVSVFARSDAASLEEELSAEIARIRAGEFVPTPSEWACGDCPALDVVCAGPRLRRAVGA
jgi:ATP-dependent exoDNAse (exonuclease V) beta subunit